MSERFYADGDHIRDRKCGAAPITRIDRMNYRCLADVARLLNNAYADGLAEGARNAPLPVASAVPLDRMIECARRELAMRRRVYPRRLADDRMPAEVARDEINAMTAIVTILTALNGGQSSKQPELAI